MARNVLSTGVMDDEKPGNDPNLRRADERSARSTASPLPAPRLAPSVQRYTFAFDRWLPTAEMNEFVWA